MANITIEEIRTIFESLKNYPIYRARKRAQIIGISRATIQKYESIANQHNLNAEDVVSMTDSQLTTTFNIHSRNKEFIEPVIVQLVCDITFIFVNSFTFSFF